MNTASPALHMNLQCPMPKLDFDVITLGHGSGGLLTRKLLEAGVFDLLRNDYLDQRHDGVILPTDGKVAFTTDSFVVSPIFFPGGNIGDLAINGTVNDLAMCGAVPKFLSLSFILEEGLTMTEFWDVLVSLKHAADKAGVQIVTGDTKVVERGKGDKLFINTAGIGNPHPKAEISLDRVQPGDAILVSGPLAAHGMAIMSVREGLSFETDILSDSMCLNHAIVALLDAFGPDVALLRDPTRGGLATTLSEIARDRDLGIEIAEKHLPIDPQVAGACEMLGLDPLYVANEGVFAAIVRPEVAEAALALLRQRPECPRAAIIGHVTEAHPRQVLLQSGIGGKRVLSLLPGEQLPRIC